MESWPSPHWSKRIPPQGPKKERKTGDNCGSEYFIFKKKKGKKREKRHSPQEGEGPLNPRPVALPGSRGSCIGLG